MEQQVSKRKAEPYNFRNLALWQRGQGLALSIIKMTEALPTTQAARTIARQVVASSGSIGANIAEGHGRYSVATYRNHLSIARGSVAETDSWLDLLQRAGFIAPTLAADLHRECETLLAGLTRQMQALGAKLRSEKGSRIGENTPEYSTDKWPDESMP